MLLDKYISDLLYRYDCVIIPNFGGFITNSVGSFIDEKSHTFYPPTKKISFNTNLKHNDGLLANYVANVDNTNYEKALLKIKIAVNALKLDLKKGTVIVGNIGSFLLNSDNQIVFEPNPTTNYLTNSFGLSPLLSNQVQRYHQKVKPLAANKEEKNRIPVFIKYAATAAILLTLGFASWKSYEYSSQKIANTKQEKVLEQKIQSATFVINNPLPTIELQVEKEIPKKYHVIAGAFQFVKNAEKKVNQLQKKGYKASILGKNKWGLTQVAFQSYASHSEALKALRNIRNTVSKDAWMLTQQFD